MSTYADVLISLWKLICPNFSLDKIILGILAITTKIKSGTDNEYKIEIFGVFN